MPDVKQSVKWDTLPTPYQNSLLDIIHSIVILLQNCLGSGQLQVLLTTLTPRDGCQPVQVVPCNANKHTNESDSPAHVFLHHLPKQRNLQQVGYKLLTEVRLFR